MLKRMEQLGKRLLLGLAGAWLQKAASTPSLIDTDRIRKVLILRYDRIGDMVVSLPVVDNLKARFPEVQISIMCSPVNYPLVQEDPRFDQLFVYAKKPIHDFRETLKMRRERFDCVIDLVKGDSTSILFVIRMIVKGKPRIGLRKLKFKPYYEFSYCDDPFEQEHMARTTLEALRPFGVDPKLAKPYAAPYVSDASNRLANSFFAQVSNVTDTSRPPLLVGINLLAGHPSRRWPLPNYQELLARLGSEYGQTVRLVLITTPNERYLAEEILSSTSDNTLVVPPNLSIAQVAGIIARLDLVVSPDTSIIHIARAFQIPVVGLYTAERMNFKHWHPYGDQEGAVISTDENSLSGLTVEMAFKRLAGQLALLSQEEREHR